VAIAASKPCGSGADERPDVRRRREEEEETRRRV